MRAWLERLRTKLIHKLGGYIDATEAINDVEGMDERRQLLTRAVRRLFNTIGPEDILQTHPSGGWKVEGKLISEGERTRLIAEAEQFERSLLWKVLQNDIRYQANRAMFEKALTADDLVAGKMSLYNLDIVRTRLKSMKKGSAHFNS